MVNIESILKDYDIDQLREVKELVDSLINEKLNANRLVKVEWESKLLDYRQHGRPYLAVLKKGDNGRKYNYEFLPVVLKYEGKKMVKGIWKGVLPIGTCLRGRVNSSWKNDYTYFYVVGEHGLEKANEDVVLRKLELI